MCLIFIIGSIGMMLYEWIKKNWSLIVIGFVLLLTLSGTGILGIRAGQTRKHLDTARERIVNLEGSLSEAGNRVTELEVGLGRLGGDYRKLESDHKILKKQYLDLRGHYTAIEAGNRELQESNNRSLRLIERGLDLIRQIRTD